MKYVNTLTFLILGSFVFSQGGGGGNHDNLGCAELDQNVCESLPFCVWNPNMESCVDGEFD